MIARFPLAIVSLAVIASSSSACLRFSAQAKPNHVPIANVASSTITAYAGDVVTLDGSTSTDPDGDKLTFTWKQVGATDANTVALSSADGAKATFVAPDHAGHLLFALTVSDGVATSAATTIDVDVHVDPSAQITGPTSGPPGVVVELQCAPQTTGVSDDALKFDWKLNGAACNGTNCVATGSTISFTPASEGASQIELVVEDGPLHTAPVLATYTATNGAPVVVLAPITGPLHSGDTVPLAVTSPTGDGFTYNWSIQNGADATLGAPSSPSCPLHVASHGSVTVSVDVQDTTTQAAGSANLVIDVDDTAPTIAMSANTFATSPGSPLSIAATINDADAADAATATWTLLSSPIGAATPTLAGADTATLTFTSTTRTPTQNAAECVTDASGCYQLLLTASDGTLSSTQTVFVVVADRAPTVTVDTPLTGVTSQPIVLNAQANDVDNDTVTFAWSVIDAPANGSVCKQTPSPCIVGADAATAAFTAPDGGDGTYSLNVVVSDGTESASATVVVIVSAGGPPPNHAPVAHIDVDTQSIVSGGVVQLDGSASSDPDNDSIASFAWSVIDEPAGSVATFSPASADIAAPSLSLRGRGAYTVQLVITDARGLASAPATIRVGATNAPPVVSAGSDVSIADRSSVALSGSASDADGDAIAFRWSVVDAPNDDVASGVLTNAGSADATFTPTLRTVQTDPAACALHECYVLELDAFDGFDHATDTLVVTSTNAAPIANAGDDQPNAGEHVALDGTASSDPDGDALTSFTWTQIAGPDVTGGTGALTGAIASFTAPSPATYAFSLVVSDGSLASSADDVVVVVPHVDRAPVVTAPNANVTAIAGDKFPLHVDVFDADADPTNVAWTLVRGDATRFATSLAGTDPSLTAPALRALLAANANDNSATYSVTATDPDGKTSPPIVVNVFVLPGAEHVVLAPNGVDSGTCGPLADPCATLSRALSNAAVLGDDVIAIGSTFTETTGSGGVPWPANVSFAGGRDATTFARTSTATTVQCQGTTDANTTCLLFLAGDTVPKRVDNLAVIADPGASTSTIALRCDRCTASFRDVSASASTSPLSIALLVDAGAGGPDATPTFAGLAAKVDDACDEEAILVDDPSVLTAANVNVDVGPTAAGCASTTTLSLSVHGGTADFTNATLLHAGAQADVGGSIRLQDSKLVVDAGDGVHVADGSATFANSVLASTSGTGIGVRFDAQPSTPSASFDTSAITGFASSVDLANNGVNASFVSSFASLPASCDGATATTTADLAASGAFATTCQASGLVAALGRTCTFTADFALVDPTCLN